MLERLEFRDSVRVEEFCLSFSFAVVTFVFCCHEKPPFWIHLATC